MMENNGIRHKIDMSGPKDLKIRADSTVGQSCMEYYKIRLALCNPDFLWKNPALDLPQRPLLTLLARFVFLFNL
jgi:hypothetical protein